MNSILPESIRWLRVQSKYDQATKIMRTMARINKKQVPEKVFEVTEEVLIIIYCQMTTVLLGKYNFLISEGIFYSYIYTKWVISFRIIKQFSYSKVRFWN